MTTLHEKMAGLPDARRAKIEARAAELIAEEKSLQRLRKAHKKTQVAVAQKLGIGQDGVSRLEQRSDMLISTLRDYVTALGGSMRVVVAFEGEPDIELETLGILAEPKIRPAVRRKPAGRKRPDAVA